MISEHDLGTAKLYFEELIGCVVGCGCWEAGWDAEEHVRAFAVRSFRWPNAQGPADVLAALDRIDDLTPDELADACVFLELHFEDVSAFRAFWAPSRAALRAALNSPYR